MYPSASLLLFYITEPLGVDSEGLGTPQDRHRTCKIRPADRPYGVGERNRTRCCSGAGYVSTLLVIREEGSRNNAHH